MWEVVVWCRWRLWEEEVLARRMEQPFVLRLSQNFT